MEQPQHSSDYFLIFLSDRQCWTGCVPTRGSVKKKLVAFGYIKRFEGHRRAEIAIVFSRLPSDRLPDPNFCNDVDSSSLHCKDCSRL
jgi:hypothetical protein